MKKSAAASAQKIAIITGTSGGIGAAIVRILLEANYRVFGLARREASPLIFETELAKNYVHYHVDISKRSGLEKTWNAISPALRLTGVESVALINNAGIEKPIVNFECAEPDDLEMNLATNLIGPLILSALFIRETEPLTIDKRIINITSGLATRNLSGLGAYCVSKAGLEMLTRQITEEQKTAKNPVIAISARPAVVATAMAARLREAPLSEFPAANTFRGMHDRGELEKPLAVAEALVRDLLRGEVLSGACYRFGDGVFNLIQ